ncbi:MAG: indole-3-glycerol phosphate synthase TrpC [Rhodospirillales bacterium]|jgi:indole-3-glycerol phosphate synthase|nr:indole-3-glycerol phosphate synthase TrpC [Rhodospirillales bacterium]
MTAPRRNILEEICAAKREHVRRCKRERPLSSLDAEARAADPPRGFARALANATAAGGYGLICEIKRASPSKGLIRADFDPPSLARAYAEAGAACLSVLTDAPYFQGAPEHLAEARTAVELPVLRKDFMVDPYQIVEARAMGADCVLVILAAVDDGLARELASTAAELGMDILCEVHARNELVRALAFESAMIGINNRDLKTLRVDLATTEDLASDVPEGCLVVGESGLATPDDLARLARVGVRCFLVGEALMRQADVAAATRALLAPVPAATVVAG